MKIILLAAGQSKRMDPVPDKNFLLFMGKPLIVHQINQLLYSGFDDFVVIAGEHNLKDFESLKNEEYEFGDPKIQIVEQEDLAQGMAGALISCKDIIGDEPICVVSANDIVAVQAYKLIQEECANNNFESYIVGKKVDSYFPGGYLEIENDGLIKGIIEKPGEGNEPSDLVNIVIHCHKNPQKLIQKLESTQTEHDDQYEVALDAMIKEGVKMKALEFDGYWHPIKFPWHVFKVMDFFFENREGHISDKAEIAETAIIRNKDKVIIEDGARIFDNVVINGPCYIGKNVIVANNSLVRNSMINANSVIGFSTEVARSYLGEDVWTHTNYIGDSIICNNCSFGSGAVTGNLRLDEEEVSMNVKGKKMSTGTNKFGNVIGENVRIGVNASLMPGIKIGNNSFVAGGLIIPQDIDDNSFVKGKVELEIKENKVKNIGEKRQEMKDKLK